VLVTGSEGLIGAELVQLLQAEEHEVVRFDLENGDDVLDAVAVRGAACDCEAILHLAAILDPRAEADRVMAVNLLGTWNVLSAARVASCRRVVFYSSVNALGVFMGEQPPDYLPIDDDHPCRPRSTYGLSKLLAEEMCQRFTDMTGIVTICLRLPAVWSDAHYAKVDEARRIDPRYEWVPYWEYGAFLDVRDAAEVGHCALCCRVGGHARVLLCASDISSSGATSLELAQRLYPDVPWRGGREYQRDPHTALVDTSRARTLLDWQPRHTWRDWVARSGDRPA
jgi:nucleoside-diphosphate-sugar epimerase